MSACRVGSVRGRGLQRVQLLSGNLWLLKRQGSSELRARSLIDSMIDAVAAYVSYVLGRPLHAAAYALLLAHFDARSHCSKLHFHRRRGVKRTHKNAMDARFRAFGRVNLNSGFERLGQKSALAPQIRARATQQPEGNSPAASRSRRAKI